MDHNWPRLDRLDNYVVVDHVHPALTPTNLANSFGDETSKPYLFTFIQEIWGFFLS